MTTPRKLSVLAAALLITASAGAVYADTANITQTQTRTQLNLQLPESDFSQYRNRDEHTVMTQSQNQYKHQYKYMNKYQNKDSSSANASMNRVSTTNRYMQGSAATGSMNRVNTAGRSMSGGRR